MAVAFDGATYYELATPGTLGSSLPVSMCCWFKITGLTTRQRFASIENNGTNVGGLYLEIAGDLLGDPIYANEMYYSSQRQAQITYSVSADTWYFAGARFVSATSRIVYLNTTSGSDTNNLSFSSKDGIIQIGHAKFGNSFFTGSLASMAAWNTDIGDTAMKAMGGSGGGWLGPDYYPSGLVFHWKGDTLDRYDEITESTMTRTGTGDSLDTHPDISYASDAGSGGLLPPSWLDEVVLFK